MRERAAEESVGELTQSILPPSIPTSDRDNFLFRAPIDARFVAMRSSCRPLYVHLTCIAWYTLELGDRCPQAWVSPMLGNLGNWRWMWLVESKDYERLCLDARWRDQGSRVCIELGVQIDSPSSESIPMSNDVVLKDGLMMIKANVAAYGIGRGPPANVLATNLGSTNDGCPTLVLNRSGLAIITDRVWRFIRTENLWVGDSHSVYYQTFQVQVQAWKVGEASVKNSECLVFSEDQVFRRVKEMEN
ncbi:hypothetical protein PIB30_019491 [Stylosanthes scabra]|uniref:Uncharacterized protein n=1 Tax=Stylosanthes scabra TaxID=79078 RepID=A0ABU6U751_9FABA|nr:hypothetical protein [Stylosanthes scabra]